MNTMSFLLIMIALLVIAVVVPRAMANDRGLHRYVDRAADLLGLRTSGVSAQRPST
jgi:hypothetical protein